MGWFQDLVQTIAHGKSDSRVDQELDNAVDRAKADLALQREQNQIRFLQQQKTAKVMEVYFQYAGVGLVIIFGGIAIIKLL